MKNATTANTTTHAVTARDVTRSTRWSKRLLMDVPWTGPMISRSIVGTNHGCRSNALSRHRKMGRRFVTVTRLAVTLDPPARRPVSATAGPIRTGDVRPWLQVHAQE